MAAGLNREAQPGERPSPPCFPGAAALAHPIFDPFRDLLERLAADGTWPDVQRLNALAAALGIEPRTASGMPIRFVAPTPDIAGYELHIHRTGCVPTRPGNLHDLFNALVWLTFPRFKATLNALHVDEIPREGGRRGRFRDLLTLLDEGGALAACTDPELVALVRAHRWKELFWDRRERLLREMRLVVVGHAVLEKALAPWPGISCKAVFLEADRALPSAPIREQTRELDAKAAAWLAGLPRTVSPREVPPLPVFGYPGWSPGSMDAAFYADERYFRPCRQAPDAAPASLG